MKTQAYKWKPYTELLNWKKSEICWKFEMENHDTTLWFSFVWSQKKSSERNLQKGVSIIQGASCGRRRDNQLHSWAARSVRYDLNYCTSTHLIPVAIWCKHRWKDSQRFHSYTCADFISGRREKHFSLVWMKLQDLYLYFISLGDAVGFVPAITTHVHQYWSNNANFVPPFVYFTAISVESQTRLKLKWFSFTEPCHGPRKFAPILNHLNVKKSPSANYSLSHFSWRWGKLHAFFKSKILFWSCGNLGFIVMRLTWKALYKHVNEAQQQLRSQEERVHNKRGWLKGTSGRKRPCDSPICIKERNCTR